ncbi:hypothetical protein [Amycolatopsis sp. Hca4]|uniref:hypothetical protein n=1 Tax=Amycolatopsis sp. Hca4 TaxID=2742131 RepID=UPI001590176B|nr:hypothetical protein [Amycolatopsis sp. Hca4]QKV74097.1 hypothetical protein HUT10_10185 [Amycolatopsis sp. Hca4]
MEYESRQGSDCYRPTRRRIAEHAEEWRRTAAALQFWEINDIAPGSSSSART